jgi:hypothetical protein
MPFNDPGLSAVEAIANTFKKKYNTPDVAQWKGHSLEWVRGLP